MVASTNIDFFETEFGKRPKDWIPTPISAIVSDFRGGAPLAPSDFKEFGFLVLPKGGVLRGGNLLVEKEKQQYCSLAYAERHKSNIIDKEYTIVVLRDLVPSGPNIGLIVRINSNEKYILAQGVYGFKVNSDNYSSDFLIHLSNTNEYRKVMRNIMVGSTQVHITNKSFLKVEIPLPPIKSEQSTIAAALNDADALITSLEKLIKKKLMIKQGAMQQLLAPKANWLTKKLGEIASIQRGASPRPIESPIWFDENSKVGWVRISDVSSSKKYLLETTQKLSEQGIKNSRFVKSGELIMSICATVGRPILTTFDVCIHDGFVAFYNPKIDTEFLYYYLTFIEDEWSKSGQTGSQMNLNSDIIQTKEFTFPISIEEQKAIAETLSVMDVNILMLEQNLSKYRMLKQGMMQELLTGKIRLV